MPRKYKDVDPDIIGPEFVHDEDEIARILGVQKHLVHVTRGRCKERLEGLWTLDNGAVLYTREGVYRLMEALGVTLSDLWRERVAEASHVGPDWRKLTQGCRRAMVRALTTNRTILFASLLDDADRMIVRVNVGISDHFVPGMELCVRVVSAPDLFELVGARPRATGVW